MRRILMGAVVLAAATGCEYEPLFFERQASLDTNARGVALHDDGYTAQVGMVGTTCEFDKSSGSLGTDYDYPGDDEVVQDVGEDDNGDVVVVVTSDKGTHVQRTDDWFWADSEDYDMTGAEDAEVVGPHVLVFRENGARCSVDVVGGDRPERTHLPDDLCVGHNTVSGDPTTGNAFIGTESGAYVVSGGEIRTVDEGPAELVVWDSVADVLYAASPGDTVLRGLEADGGLRFSTDVGGAILDLEAMGSRGAAAVSVQRLDGLGEVVVVDGFTGVATSRLNSPEPASDISTSDDGRSLALVKAGRVDFYDVFSWW